MNSLEMVPYSNTVLAAGALYQDLTKNRNLCKKIYDTLPIESETAVKILVVTDRINLSNQDDKIYHAANILLKKDSNGKLNITATIDSYIDLQYTKPYTPNNLINNNDNNNNNNNNDNNDNRLDNVDSSVDFFLKRYSIINDPKDTFSDYKGNNCETVLKIYAIFKEIFSEGIPLPTDQRFHQAKFEMSTKINNCFQHLSINYGVRATYSQRGKLGESWSSSGLYSTNDEKEFEKLKREAKGDVIPAGIPNTAVSLFRNMTSSVTGAYKKYIQNS